MEGERKGERKGGGESGKMGECVCVREREMRERHTQKAEIIPFHILICFKNGSPASDKLRLSCKPQKSKNDKTKQLNLSKPKKHSNTKQGWSQLHAEITNYYYCYS